jgi:two-component system, OmpR family, sensor histidine kinase VicK
LKLDESKNTILNIVAHDLRSPISGITNLVRLMLKQEKSEEKQKYLEIIESSGAHSMSIIQDLLEMAQLENESNLSSKESTELNSFIKECILIHQFQMKDKSIQVQFKSSLEKIYHDINRDKMKRAFSNLISNAIKFSHENGKIEIYLYRENRKTVIKISDFGVGIPEDLIGSVFEKFSHARRVGTKGENSIGLGMSIAKEIIDKHQGKIRIESEENKGTTIYIEL